MCCLIARANAGSWGLVMTIGTGLIVAGPIGAASVPKAVGSTLIFAGSVLVLLYSYQPVQLYKYREKQNTCYLA